MDNRFNRFDEEAYIRQHRENRNRQRRTERRIRVAVILIFVLILLSAACAGGYVYLKHRQNPDAPAFSLSTLKEMLPFGKSSSAPEGGSGAAPAGEGSGDANPADSTAAPAETAEPTTEAPTEPPLEQQIQDLIAKADRLSAGYDNPAAVELIKTYAGYENVPQLTEAIARYEATQASYVRYEAMDTITHVFYHTLIADTSLAFDGDEDTRGYNQVMTTIDEFNKITLEMYNRGFVLVSLHDIAHLETGEDGQQHMVWGDIYLPEGKKPYVLSQDDVSYYHYMDGDGFATRLVVGEDGRPTCEYVQPDGTVVYGAYDMVPLIDQFIDEHPDASYRGAKGIIALTGYNGILGYRTDFNYEEGGDRDQLMQNYLDTHPDFNIEEERRQATEVAACMEADGWEFASHSWGHRDLGEISEFEFYRDCDWWNENVNPLLGGDTDIIIYAFGADIGTWHPYTYDNFRYKYLKELGFNYFCNVDSAQYWVQLGDDYLRQGRRNLDGQRMWEAISGGTDRLSDLFDARQVFDSARPTPVE